MLGFVTFANKVGVSVSLPVSQAVAEVIVVGKERVIHELLERSDS